MFLQSKKMCLYFIVEMLCIRPNRGTTCLCTTSITYIYVYIIFFSAGLFNSLSVPLHQVEEVTRLRERCSSSPGPSKKGEEAGEMKSQSCLILILILSIIIIIISKYTEFNALCRVFILINKTLSLKPSTNINCSF